MCFCCEDFCFHAGTGYVSLSRDVSCMAAERVGYHNGKLRLGRSVQRHDEVGSKA